MKYYAFNRGVCRYFSITPKILLIMKLIVVMLTACMMQVSAATFAQKITYTQKNSTLEQLFTAITKQTGYYVIFAGDKIDKNAVLNVSFKNTDLKEVLYTICTKSQLTYTIDENNISLKPKNESFLDKIVDIFRSINVRGRVVDKSGLSIAGASIKVKGTTKTTTTNETGDFYLADIEENSTLVISYIGFVTRELTAKADVGNIRLEEAIGELEEVGITVNNGYQTISKERSAGSFSKPDMTVIAQRSTSMNILQRLDGLVPGLVVNNSPGATENPFLIRGLSTIGTYDQFGRRAVQTNRNPLYVVDGVAQENIAAINPQDIADITVLKDATAASIWGTRAANGVIVITTKKGTGTGKLTVNYDGFANFSGRPDLNYIPRMKSPAFITAMKEIFPDLKAANSWGKISQLGSVPPHLDILYNNPTTIANQKLDSLSAIDNTDQISKLFYRNSLLTNHTISVSSGGKLYSFYGSGSYTGNRSNTPGNADNTYKMNLRQDLNFGDRLQIFVITDLSNQRSSALNNFSSNPFGDESYYRFITRSTYPSIVPYQKFADDNGNPIPVNFLTWMSDPVRRNYENLTGIDLSYSPLEDVNQGYYDNESISARIVGGLRLKLFKGLRFEGTYGYTSLSSNGRLFLDQNSYEVRRELLDMTRINSDGVAEHFVPETGGRLTENNQSNRDWTVRNQLVFDHSWENHELTVLFGQEAMERKSRISRTVLRGWNDQLQTYLPVDYKYLSAGLQNNVTGVNNILAPNFVGGDLPLSRTTSYYSNLSYTFARKYALNASWRIDESNLFGRDKSAQNRPVWSVGGKWTLSNENFMKDVKAIDMLALRMTYGVSGNAPQPGTAASYDILKSDVLGSYVTGQGLILSSPGNAKLTWESTQTLNLGIDFSLLGTRFGGSIDGYIKKTDDLLGNLAVSAFTGFQNVVGNFGSMENKGIELNLQSINLQSKNFTWTSGFTLGYNKNKVTKLNLLGTITTGSQMVAQQYVPGYPAFAVFAYNYAGLNNQGDPQIRKADGTITSDANSSLAEDIKFMGTYQPIWSGGLSNTFQHGPFELSVNMIYNLGNVLRRDVNDFWTSSSSYIGYATSPHEEFSNRWKVPGDESNTNIPRFLAATGLDGQRNTGYYTSGDLNVFSASFVKIRDLTLAYSLPPRLISKMKAERLTIRCQLSNVMLWKANDYGIDPEFHYMSQSAGVRSLRTGQNAVTIGAHLTF